MHGKVSWDVDANKYIWSLLLMQTAARKEISACLEMTVYREGDVIFRSDPWVYSVLSSAASRVCYRCLQKPKHAAVRRCSRCAFAHYCSEVCQKEDWSERHQTECKIVRDAAKEFAVNSGSEDNMRPLDFFLVLCKMITKLKRARSGDMDEEACYPPMRRTFDDLMTHEAEFTHNPTVESMYNVYELFISKLDRDRLVCPDRAAFARLYGKFNINAFSIADYFEGDIGKGLYLGPSVLDHSCIPNAVQMFAGKSLIVKAVRDIPRFEDVRISYVSTLAVPQVRQEYLMQNYFFHCSCAACLDGKLLAARHAVRCSQSTCPVLVPLDDRNGSKCPVCETDNSEQLRKGREIVYRIMEQQRTVEADVDGRLSVEEKLRLLMASAKEFEKFLHPTNFLLGLVYRDLSVLLASINRRDDSMKYLMKALLPMRQHLNKFESEFTGALSDISHWLAEKRKFEDALVLAKELENILSVVPGKDSAVFKEYAGFAFDCELAAFARAKPGNPG